MRRLLECQLTLLFQAEQLLHHDRGGTESGERLLKQIGSDKNGQLDKGRVHKSYQYH